MASVARQGIVWSPLEIFISRTFGQRDAQFSTDDLKKVIWHIVRGYSTIVVPEFSKICILR